MTERRFYPPTKGDIPVHGWSPYDEVHRERMRAHAKHDVNGHSMERRDWRDAVWLPVLTEEVGEVARVLCEGEDGLTPEHKAHLREELVQVAAMTIAWIDAIDLTPDESSYHSKIQELRAELKDAREGAV